MKNCSLAGILLIFFLYVSCASVNKDILSEERGIASDFSGIVHAGETGTKEEFDYLNYIGVSWILHTFYWDRIEPQKNNWNFESYDVMVNNARNAGIKVFGVLAYDNRWIHSDQNDHNYIPSERLPDFLDYVQKTVEHFRGRVDAWCVWNEPNGHFWKGTVDEYVELIRQTAAVIKETDSDVIVLGGAFNRNVTGLPKKMINRLFESGAMENVDAVAFHPYEISANRTKKLYDQFEKIAAQYGYKDKIWITEIGYPTGGWYPSRVSEKKFPSRVIKTFTLLAAAGAKKVFWYQMFDSSNPSKSNSEDFFGLVRSAENYISKGAEALRLCALYVSDSICYVQKQDDLPSSLQIFWFKKKNGGALVLWKDRLGSAQVRLELPGTDHKQHDIVTGNASLINSDIVINVGNKPVFITWRNIAASSNSEGSPVIGRKNK
jgi:hypothetical protein